MPRTAHSIVVDFRKRRHMSITAKSLFCILCLLMLNTVFAGESKSAADASVYRINEGDVLELSVWKEDGLTREVTVSPDGTLSFPLVGLLNARQKTVDQIREELTRKIAAYIPDPSVTVTLKAAQGSLIYVIGKVNRPGQFPLTGPTSVLQALSMAGGTTPFADYDDIKIIRSDGGHENAIKFNYGDIEDGENLDSNVTLKSGDVVVVP